MVDTLTGRKSRVLSQYRDLIHIFTLITSLDSMCSRMSRVGLRIMVWSQGTMVAVYAQDAVLVPLGKWATVKTA